MIFKKKILQKKISPEVSPRKKKIFTKIKTAFQSFSLFSGIFMHALVLKYFLLFWNIKQLK